MYIKKVKKKIYASLGKEHDFQKKYFNKNKRLADLNSGSAILNPLSFVDIQTNRSTQVLSQNTWIASSDVHVMS